MNRRWLLVTVIVFLGVALVATVAIAATAAPPASSVPAWMWGVVTGVVVLLLGMVGFFVKRYMRRQDKAHDRLILVLDGLDSRLDRLGNSVARIDERIAALPCRSNVPSNGIPPAPSPLCSLNDRDPVKAGQS